MSLPFIPDLTLRTLDSMGLIELEMSFLVSAHDWFVSSGLMTVTSLDDKTSEYDFLFTGDFGDLDSLGTTHFSSADFH